MRVLVVGGGAVGSLLAWTLRSGGAQVWVARRRHQGPAMAAPLVVADRGGAARSLGITVVGRPDELETAPDLIVFAVKMFDLPGAVTSCGAWRDVPALTVQNGIGAELLVARARPQAGLIAGSLTASVEAAEDGGWRRRTRGGLGLAQVEGRVGSMIEELAELLEAGGLSTQNYDDPMAMKWSKLVGNLAANATAALLDYDPGRIYRHRRLFLVERAQVLECLAVMARLRLRPVALPGADIPLLARAFRLPPWLGRPILAPIMARARGGKDPSLRLHARGEGGRSEVDWLNGAVVKAGRSSGIETPVNRRLAELVNEALTDPGRRAWFRHRPSRLVEAVGLPQL